MTWAVGRHLAAGWLFCAAALQAAPPPWPHRQSDLEPDPAIVFGELDNGLRYAILPNAEPPGRVSLRLFVRAGSLNERDDQRGLAHFLEHMAFQGTEHFTPGTMVAYFQNLGMGFGPDANAYTGFERTVYQIELPDHCPDAIEQALFVFREYAGRMRLEEEAVESERGVILSEMRSRDTIGFRTAIEEFAFLLPESIIAERFPIGTEPVVRAADRAALLDFYESWYRPERIKLAVVGDADPEVVAERIRRQFEDFAPKRPEPGLPDPGRVTRREGVSVRLHPEPEAASVRVSLQQVHPFEAQPDTRAAREEQLVRSVAAQMLQRRLDRQSRQENAPFSRAAAGAYDRFDFYRHAFVSLVARPGQWRETVHAAERELRRALTHGFLDSELEEVRAIRINALEEAVRRAPTRRSRERAEWLVSAFTGRRVPTSPESELTLARPVLENLCPDRCVRALREAFPDDGRLLFVTGPLDLPDPEHELFAAYREAAALPVEPPAEYEDAVFAYETFGPPGRVVRAERAEDLDVSQFRFDNGVRLNLKRTDFAAGEILLAARFGAGRLDEPADAAGLARLAGDTFIAGGLGRHSADELRRILAGRNVGWSFQVDDDAFVFRGRTTPGDLPLQLRLLAAYLSDPGYRDEALRQARDGYDDLYAEARHTPRGVLRDRVARFLAGGDARFGLPDRDRLSALTLEDTREWLDRPLREGYLEISIAGDFGEPESVVEEVAATLGALSARAGEKEVDAARRLLRPAEPGRERRFEFPSRIPSGFAAVYWPTADAWDMPRTRRLGLLARVFSDRMRERIREDMGEAYSAFAANQASDTYRDYGWMIGLVGVAPDMAGEVADAIVEIAGELHGGDIDEEQLQRALRPTLTSLRASLRDNGYWLNSVLSGSQEFPQRLDWARTRLDDFAAITVEDLRALARRYLDPAAALRVLVLPVPDDDNRDP